MMACTARRSVGSFSTVKPRWANPCMPIAVTASDTGRGLLRLVGGCGHVFGHPHASWVLPTSEMVQPTVDRGQRFKVGVPIEPAAAPVAARRKAGGIGCTSMASGSGGTSPSVILAGSTVPSSTTTGSCSHSFCRSSKRQPGNASNVVATATIRLSVRGALSKFAMATVSHPWRQCRSRRASRPDQTNQPSRTTSAIRSPHRPPALPGDVEVGKNADHVLDMVSAELLIESERRTHRGETFRLAVRQ